MDDLKLNGFLRTHHKRDRLARFWLRYLQVEVRQERELYRSTSFFIAWNHPRVAFYFDIEVTGL